MQSLRIFIHFIAGILAYIFSLQMAIYYIEQIGNYSSKAIKLKMILYISFSLTMTLTAIAHLIGSWMKKNIIIKMFIATCFIYTTFLLFVTFLIMFRIVNDNQQRFTVTFSLMLLPTFLVANIRRPSECKSDLSEQCSMELTDQKNYKAMIENVV